MAKVTDQSFDHDYDGIKEYDNPLPRWWMWLFILSVVYAVVYVPYYHFGPGQLPTQVYDDDMAAWLAAHPPEPLPDEEAMIAIAGDGSILATGQSIFTSRCTACHGPDGGGLVGPNLTDDYTIHGYSRAAIVRVVHDGGRPNKGMQPWKDQLSREEIYAVALYVHSLRGTTPTNPKAPEGDPIVDEASGTPAAGDDAAGDEAVPTDADDGAAGAPDGADVATDEAAGTEGEPAEAATEGEGSSGDDTAGGSGEAEEAAEVAPEPTQADPAAAQQPEAGGDAEPAAEDAAE